MKSDKPLVFYSASPPSVMTYKIARLFYKKGYKTILITMCEKEALDIDFYKDAFHEIIVSNFQFFKPNKKTFFYILKRGYSFIKFLIKMRFLKPYVIIGISGANWQLKLVHKYFFKKYPFIYFPYDILSQFYNSEKEAFDSGVKKFELNAERYCLENSDGLIHKGSPKEPEFFEERNMIYPKLNIHFSTYCSKEFSVPINKNKLSKKDGEIHIAYIGFFFDDKESMKNIINYFNEIIFQKMHLHVYMQVKHIPKNQADVYFNNLLSKFTKSKYFHIHPSFGPKEIIKEISSFDYSFWFASIFGIPELRYHIGNKFSSYFEAGVPMIYIKKSFYVDEIMNHYGLHKLGFSRNLKNLREKLKKLNYEELQRKVILARKDFDMDKNFFRLEEFIKKVVEKKYKK